MSKRMIGFIVIFAVLAGVIVFGEDIRAMADEAMMQQTESFVDQLLR